MPDMTEVTATALCTSLGIDPAQTAVVAGHVQAAAVALNSAVMESRGEALPMGGDVEISHERIIRGMISELIDRCTREFQLRQFGLAYVDPVTNEFSHWILKPFPDTATGHEQMRMVIQSYNSRQSAENPENLLMVELPIGTNDEPSEE